MKTRLPAPACAALLTLLPPTAAHVAATKCPKYDIRGWSRPNLKGERVQRNTAGP